MIPRNPLGAILDAALGLSASMRVDGRTGVRRTVGTADWKHDPERLAAAQAKRERRQRRNQRNVGLPPVPREVNCPSCFGDGRLDNGRGLACKECGGTGMRYV